MNHKHFGKRLTSGFFNDIYLDHDKSTVIKVPKLTTKIIGETKEKLLGAIAIHHYYLGDAMVETDVKNSILSPLGYIIEQPYCEGTLLCRNDLDDEVLPTFDNLVMKGMHMETSEKIFFDIYGWDGVVHNITKIINRNANYRYANIMYTPEKTLKYIDISYLPMSNPLVWCAVQCRDVLNLLSKRK